MAVIVLLKKQFTLVGGWLQTYLFSLGGFIYMLNLVYTMHSNSNNEYSNSLQYNAHVINVIYVNT